MILTLIFNLTNTDLQLIVKENKAQRKIYEPTFEQGDWRRRHNKEIRALYKNVNTIGELKCRKLRWAGHVLRKEEG